jgi:uracil-DNA glycosylase family 4
MCADVEEHGAALAQMHERVHHCQRCFGAAGCHMAPDELRVPRQLPEQLVSARVMVVGEAIGRGTQRLSGLPYIEPSGRLRPAGGNLDRFLERFGYTIRPDGAGQYVYSTDLVRCVPLDQSRLRLRPPTRTEAANCMPWLVEEITLVRPQVVVLLGLHATGSFFERFMGRTVRRLGDVAGGPYATQVGGHPIVVYAVPHPSPLASRPERNALYEEVATSIRGVLVSAARRPASPR